MNTKFRDIPLIMRYQFDGDLTTKNSLNVERQRAVTSLLTQQQNPDISEVTKKHKVSFLRRNLLFL